MKNHPYHYSVKKTFLHRLFDIGVPVVLFWAFFQFYNFGKITPSEMIKTSGLLSISLLAITLLVGPVCKLFPGLDLLKAHRKFWGITSFLIALTHIALVFIFFYKFNLLRFVDYSHPKYPGILAGLAAITILFLVTLTSSKKALNILSPGAWKAVQITSYLALGLAVGHFYLMEQVEGVFVIKRLLGRITFGLSAAVIPVRLLIVFWPTG
ncbi:MAG: ferric reductase-like transmembrane domain-containing protein, partial [Candidatus Daviesbacteria bacterium]|nr:ferric reductase-like transmembrane domain-containing protein [Candidatus Daviesbacteria bacterium]